MRDLIVAVPADQPNALSGVDSKTDIENMGSVPLSELRVPLSPFLNYFSVYSC